MNLPRPCTISNGAPCSACEEATKLEARIAADSDDDIKLMLKDLELQNKRRINELHDPFISRLPHEMTTEVLLHFLPDPAKVDEDYSPVVFRANATTPLHLGAVCHAWRQIVWSIPQLWTAISIHWFHQKFDVAARARKWLQRSGQFPLSITLCTEFLPLDISSFPTLEYIGIIAKVIFDYAPRCSHLNLDLSQAYTTEQFHHLGESPYDLRMLKSLRIHVYNSIQNHPIFSNAVSHSLTHVSLQSVSLRYKDIDIAWDNITHLTIERLGVTQFLELLRHAPRISHCTVTDLDYSVDDEQTVVHLNMWALELHCLYGINNVSMFLLWTSFPALECLTFDMPYEQEMFPIKLVAAFLDRSQCAIKTLVLHCGTINSTSFLDLLHTTPQLEILEVTDTVTDLTDFLKLLHHNVPESQQFIPNIHTLEITVCEPKAFPWRLLPGLCGFQAYTGPPSPPPNLRHVLVKLTSCGLQEIGESAHILEVLLELQLIRQSGIDFRMVAAAAGGQASVDVLQWAQDRP